MRVASKPRSATEPPPSDKEWQAKPGSPTQPDRGAESDPLRAATGVMIGVCIGSLFWLLLILALHKMGLF